MQYYTELLNSLKRGVLAPIYLFYGEEGYLREQAVRRFIEFFASDEEDDFNCELIDGETTEPAEIVALAETVPFFSDKRLVIVKNPWFFRAKAGDKGTTSAGTGKKPKKESTSNQENLLLNYLGNPLTSTCLIFTTGELPDKRRKLFKSIKKNGRTIEFTYLKKGDINRWLHQKGRERGKEIEKGAAEFLIDAVGPSLHNLHNELEKLCSFTAGGQDIKLVDVEQLVTPLLEDNIFAVVDAIGHQRSWEALRGIKELLAAKEPPLRLLSMIARQFRLLLQVRDLTDRGYVPREIISQLKLPPYVYQKIAAQTGNFSQPLLIEAITAISRLEMDLKSGRQEFYPALETYLLKLVVRSR
jgi:DNA polymerase-3 subunit delta